MTHCFFVSDLHGSESRYQALFREIKNKTPDVVLIGGDLFPHGYDLKGSAKGDFLDDFLVPEFQGLKRILGENYPEVLIILGNDDARSHEKRLEELEQEQLWKYIHNKKVSIGAYDIYGYSFIPPTPFAMKDWEKYDVSRFVDPGCSHPTEGLRTVEPDYDLEYSTIKTDLEILTADNDLSKGVFLFHSPPYNTPLDRAALDGKMIDYVPLDVHVGSIAIQRFIETRQPIVTLHGHVHEASEITGQWKTKLGETHAFSAAWKQSHLALVEFDLENPAEAKRRLVSK
ncbi:MAG: metallophosphoesterase [Bacteroidales bacterium]|nr:metallophosphoesterase [Bacteroidales bacterium]MCF8337783.1 metallophosphoesterase [Bacteroidales bacterium]